MNICSTARAYRAYDLNILSDICLPELPIGGAPADARIRVGLIGKHPSNVDNAGRGCLVEGNETCYFLKNVGAFLVSEGQDVLVEPFSEEESLGLSLLGPAMGLLLHQRGSFVLHAGAVALDNAAVAFMGGAGFGKSTLVAMLHGRGHRFLCEDVAPLGSRGGRVELVPSFPQFKLWPDAAQRLGWSPDDFPQVHPECQKRLIRFREGFTDRPAPLSRIYLLGIGSEVRIETLNPVHALEEVLRHWYGARFGQDFVRSVDRRSLFVKAAEIVRTVPVRILRRPKSFHQDPRLAERIEHEIFRDL